MRAKARLQALAAGTQLQDMGHPVSAGQAGDRLVSEASMADPEHPASTRGRPVRLQHDLSWLLDKDAGASLKANAESAPERCRLDDLRHATVNSEWLWAVDSTAPAFLEPEAYVPPVRLRLGAGFAREPLPCRGCRRVLDATGSHALRCAPGESTRGHNDVRDAVFDLAHVADATCEKEVLGLLEAAPGLRPADVLTSAVSPGLTSALDVGIAAPHALHAGDDCTETMRLKKRGTYSRHLEALAAERIEYKPLVWTCWGREHPDTTAVLLQLAKQGARRRGWGSHDRLLARAKASIGAAIARRAAGMLLACMPCRG